MYLRIAWLLILPSAYILAQLRPSSSDRKSGCYNWFVKVLVYIFSNRWLKAAGQKWNTYKTGVINDPLSQTHSLVVNIVFAWNLYCFVRFWKVGTYVRTYGQHMRKQWSLPTVAVGRSSGSNDPIEKQLGRETGDDWKILGNDIYRLRVWAKENNYVIYS